MQKINLRELYPDVYKTNVFVDVAEEVVAAIRGQEQDDAAYERRKFRHKAHYSLNREDGIENDALNRPLTPEEVLEQKLLREEVYAALMQLTAIQARRIYARFYLGMTVAEIARIEGADRRRVWESIRRGLKKLARLLDTAQYTDVERGERGSTEEHLTVTQFKVQAEQQRLEAVTGQVAQAEQNLEDAKAATAKQKKKLESLQKETKAAKTIALTVQDIEVMGKKATFGNNITLTPDECDTLKRYAVNGIIANADNKRLKEKLASAEKTVSIWKQRYEAVNEKYMELKQKAQPFLDALEIASEKVRAFINSILIRGKETQEHKHPAQKRGQDMEL